MWNYAVKDWSGAYQYSLFYVLKPFEDTLIGSNTYHKIYLGKPNTYTFLGGARETFGQSYFINRDSIQEHELFDYDKPIGDTIQNLF